MGNCIVVVRFDLRKRNEPQAAKGATSTAPIYTSRRERARSEEISSTAMPAPVASSFGRSAPPSRHGSRKIK